MVRKGFNSEEEFNNFIKLNIKPIEIYANDNTYDESTLILISKKLDPDYLRKEYVAYKQSIGIPLGDHECIEERERVILSFVEYKELMEDIGMLINWLRNRFPKDGCVNAVELKYSDYCKFSEETYS